MIGAVIAAAVGAAVATALLMDAEAFMGAPSYTPPPADDVPRTSTLTVDRFVEAFEELDR